eukprot:gene7235-11550_t
MFSPRKKSDSSVKPKSRSLRGRSSENFEITAYSIEFLSVFFVEEIKQQFYAFLKKEYNDDPFDCVLEIDSLQELKIEKEIIKKCEYIINTFIKEKAFRELNISQPTREGLMESLKGQLEEKDKWILEKDAYTLFTPLKRILMLELSADNFTRFIRSKNVEEVFSKYSENPNVMKLNTVLKYPFDDKIFDKPFISKEEIFFCEELQADSFLWEQIYSKKSYSVYTSTYKFIPGSKFFESSMGFKIITTLPFPIEKVISFLLKKDYLKQVEKGLVNFEVKDTFSMEQLINEFPKDNIANQIRSITTEICCHPPFPFNTPRKYSDVFCVHYNPQKRILYFARRPYLKQFSSNENIQWSKKMKYEFTENNETKILEGYLATKMVMYRIEFVDELTTKVSMVTLLDPKGYLQNAHFLVQNGIKMMAASIEKNFYKTLRAMDGQEITYDNFKDLKDEPFLSLVYEVMKQQNDKLLSSLIPGID